MFRIDYEEIVNQYPEGSALVALDIRFIAVLLAVSNETLSYRATWGKPDNSIFDNVTNLVHRGVDNLMAYKTLDDIFNLIEEKWETSNNNTSDIVSQLDAINSTLTNIDSTISEIEGTSGIVNVLLDILAALGGVPALTGGPFLSGINDALQASLSTGNARTITDAIDALAALVQKANSQPQITYLPKIQEDNTLDLVVNGQFLVGKQFDFEGVENFAPDNWSKLAEGPGGWPNKNNAGEMTITEELNSGIYQVIKIPSGYGALNLWVEGNDLQGLKITQRMEGEVIFEHSVDSYSSFEEFPIYGNGGETITIELSIIEATNTASWGSVGIDAYAVGIEEKSTKGTIQKEVEVVNNIPLLVDAWKVFNYWGNGLSNFALEVGANALDVLKYLRDGVTGANSPSGVQAKYVLVLHGRAKAIKVSGDFSPEIDENGDLGDSYLEFVHSHPVHGETTLVQINKSGGFSYEFVLPAMGGELFIYAYMNAKEDTDKSSAYFRDLKVITITYDVGQDV